MRCNNKAQEKEHHQQGTPSTRAPSTSRNCLYPPSQAVSEASLVCFACLMRSPSLVLLRRHAVSCWFVLHNGTASAGRPGRDRQLHPPRHVHRDIQKSQQPPRKAGAHRHRLPLSRRRLPPRHRFQPCTRKHTSKTVSQEDVGQWQVKQM